MIAFRVIRVSYRGKPFGELFLVCLFQPILYFFCETFGLKLCATSTAGLILGAAPVTVCFLAWLVLNEKPTWMRTLSLVVSLCGVGFVAFSQSNGEGNNQNTALGLLLLFGAMATASLYNVFSRKSSRIFTPVETSFAMMVAGTVIFGIFAFMHGSAAAFGNLLERAAKVWPAIVYLGGLSSFVAFFLVNFNLSRLKASQSSAFSNLSTAVIVAAGVIFRGEYFGVPQAIGATLILLGVWGANRDRTSELR
jgi:drug/metabolite transporter (DMT)-like permease